jgi:hypothetical protein
LIAVTGYPITLAHKHLSKANRRFVAKPTAKELSIGYYRLAFGYSIQRHEWMVLIAGLLCYLKCCSFCQQLTSFVGNFAPL